MGEDHKADGGKEPDVGKRNVVFILLMLAFVVFVSHLASENDDDLQTPQGTTRGGVGDPLRTPAPPPAPKPTGKWITSIDTNPLDDSRTVHLSLVADQGQSRYGEDITLVLRCKSNTTEVIILWNDYLGLDETRVTTRVGSKQAQTRTWSISTNNKAMFLRGSKTSFIKELMTVDQLIAQTTPYGENSVMAIFDIKGLDKAIGPLRETCSW